VIRWRERPAELPLHALAILWGRLSSDDAKRVAAHCTDGLVILVDRAARSAIEAHLAARRDEQGGLLVGDAFMDDAGTIIALWIRVGIPAIDFESSGVSLRMETGVWTRAREALRAGELIVGWYHSHPGLGAFFSDTDRATQRAFFPHPFSIGWVRDPIHEQDRWFVGADSDEVHPARVLMPERNPLPTCAP